MYLTPKQCVQIVRAAGCRGYDKSLHSKTQWPEYYGIRLTAAAESAIQAIAAVQNGANGAKNAPEGKRPGDRPGDRHKLKTRIFARMPKEQAERVQSAVKACGYGTVQNWIGACAYRLLREADKRSAAEKKKSPSGTAIPKGAEEKLPSLLYHGKDGAVNACTDNPQSGAARILPPRV